MKIQSKFYLWIAEYNHTYASRYYTKGLLNTDKMSMEIYDDFYDIYPMDILDKYFDDEMYYDLYSDNPYLSYFDYYKSPLKLEYRCTNKIKQISNNYREIYDIFFKLHYYRSQMVHSNHIIIH